MLLHPRKFKRKNRFKARTFKKAKTPHLLFGQYGLAAAQPLRLNNQQVYRIKLFLKKAARRADKTSRHVWFNIFPHLPLSQKVEGSRMGKGTGKLAGWVSELAAGVLIFEFRNLRYGRFLYFAAQVSFRLPVLTQNVMRHTPLTPLLLSSTRSIKYDSVW